MGHQSLNWTAKISKNGSVSRLLSIFFEIIKAAFIRIIFISDFAFLLYDSKRSTFPFFAVGI